MRLGFSNEPGATPLMLAGNASLIRKMLAQGADVNARDAKGKTALDYPTQDPETPGILQRAAGHP